MEWHAAGCNLLTQTPEIRNWLLTMAPGKQMTVGAYAFLGDHCGKRKIPAFTFEKWQHFDIRWGPMTGFK